MIDIAQVRAETPGVKNGIYLNNASCSLMPMPVIKAVQGYFAREAQAGGYPAFAESAHEHEQVYASVARLINGKASEIALFTSHATAWQSVFYGFTFRDGDRILTSQAEFSSNFLAFLQTGHRTGCVIDVIPSDNTGAADPAALDKMIDGRVKLIAINWIPTNGGLINPAAEIGKVARKHGIPYLLDACQAVGQMPVDVQEIGCDYLSAAGRKWLRGPKGSGFVWVSSERLKDAEPAMLDMGGARLVEPNRYELRDDARRFETHEHAPALRMGLGAAADYACALGLETIRDRIRLLADGLRRELAKMKGITVQDLGSDRAGLVTFSHESTDAADIVKALGEQAICIKEVPRADALLDFEVRNAPSFARASAHYFNTEEELDRFLKVLRDTLGAA